MSLDDPGNVDTRADGWEAINDVLRPVYGPAEPLHWGTIISYRLGGRDPLDGISAYPRLKPVPHWHFVTFGFSELYQKEWPDPEISGWGFELTFRPTRRPEDEQPPAWILSFLQNLARYVFSSGNRFGTGHHMDLNGPIEHGRDTPISAIAIAEDPELPATETQNGRVEFLQVVGLTRDEYDAIRSWSTEGMVEVMAQEIPLLVTDLDRSSILKKPAVRQTCEVRTAREGSSTGSLYCDAASWRVKRPPLRKPRVELTLGANPARHSAKILRGRLPFGRSFTLISKEQATTFMAGESPGWRVEGENELVVFLRDAQALELARILERGVGDSVLPGLDTLSLHVVPSIIRDPEGNVIDRIE